MPSEIEIAKSITRIIGGMLDHGPDDCGIYPTTACYEEMHSYIDRLLDRVRQEQHGRAYQRGFVDGAADERRKVGEETEAYCQKRLKELTAPKSGPRVHEPTKDGQWVGIREVMVWSARNTGLEGNNCKLEGEDDDE